MFVRSLLFLAVGLCACDGGLAPYGVDGDERLAQAFPAGDTAAYTDCQILALLDWVNDPGTGAELLKAAGVHSRAATHIVGHRDGPDGLPGSEDDRVFATVFELDAVPYVGPVAMDQLAAHAGSLCSSGDPAEPVGQRCAEESLLDYLSAPTTDEEALKAEGIHTSAARNIVAFRNGPDAAPGTADDQAIPDLEALDAIPYVGPAALEQLLALGGRLCSPAEVVMSPQPYADSHLARVTALLEQAESSVDVALYSFRDSGVRDALIAAADRGVSIRVLFHSASEDRKSPAGTRSAGLEDAGIEVRWVNKIMHHKFALVDGPRLSLDAAKTATLTTGSGNWSYSAGTRFDENTVFVTGDEKLVLLFQREFNRLWDHSRDFVWNESIPAVEAIEISEEAIEAASGSEAVFTSANFRTYTSSTYGPTFARNGDGAVVANALVEFIDSAEHSVKVASGHFRFRPLFDAMLRAQQRGVEVEVYLDGQEYTSAWYSGEQEDDYDACLDEADDEPDALADCDAQGMHFGTLLHRAGIDVRFKYYAYRWDYSYAPQMHHKTVVVDEERVASGSYNFSPNAEWDTFENVVFYEASRYPTLVEAFVANVDAIRQTGRAEGLYASLVEEVSSGSGSSFPIVFEPMALDWEEVTELKAVLRDHCPEINSEPFRTDPGSHQWCERG